MRRLPALLFTLAIPSVCHADTVVETRCRDLHSPITAVRRQAAVALGQRGDAAAVPALSAALADPEPAVRRAAALALGQLKDDRATEALVTALTDAESDVRFGAAYALGEIKAPRAAPALIKALSDPEWTVRNQAAWALRELHDPKVAATLASLLRDPQGDWEHARWVLQQVGGDEVFSAVKALLSDKDAAVRLRGLETVSDFDREEVTSLQLAALKDAAPPVRLAALKALDGATDPRVKPAVKELVDQEQDPAVREAAEALLYALSQERNLLGHWTFDDRSTEVAKDVTNRGNNGEIRGCQPVDGKVGAALRFKPGWFVECDKPPAFPLANRPFTIMAWAKPEAPTGVIVARGGAFCGFSLYVMDGVPKFGTHCLEGGPTYVAAGTEKVVGRWVHLAGVVKDKSIELYVDGKLAASTKTASYLSSDCGQGMEFGFDVGNSPAEIVDNFVGLIDEVRAYGVALSAEDIAEQYRAAESAAPPVK